MSRRLLASRIQLMEIPHAQGGCSLKQCVIDTPHLFSSESSINLWFYLCIQISGRSTYRTTRQVKGAIESHWKPWVKGDMSLMISNEPKLSGEKYGIFFFPKANAVAQKADRECHSLEITPPSCHQTSTRCERLIFDVAHRHWDLRLVLVLLGDLTSILKPALSPPIPVDYLALLTHRVSRDLQVN